MEKGYLVETLYFETLPSTQQWLVEELKQKRLSPPVCVVAHQQSNGVGSRGHAWESVKRALTFSFALGLESLPKDLPLHSSSIYFGFIFKEVLRLRGSSAWLKWPNDIYVDQHKIGGVMVNSFQDCLVCGVGVNLESGDSPYGALEGHVAIEGVLEEYCQKDFLHITWKQIFSKYRLEFDLNRGYAFHKGDKRIPMETLELLDDGSLCYEGETFFGAR